jgi:hypothetical protein
MIRSPLFLLLISVLLGGCTVAQEGPEREPVKPLAYRFTLEMTSHIADPYYVLAGGSESYGRFPFNSWARSALEKRLAARSGPGDLPVVTVAVDLHRLTTAYDEIGEGPTLHSPIYNGIGPQLLAGSDFEEGDGRALPSEIHKSAELKGTLKLRREGRTLVERPLQENVEIVIYWEDIDRWSFRYNDVLHAVVDALVKDVDAELTSRFGPAAGSGKEPGD